MSLVEWCEANVARHNYSWAIAEYFNTISNLAFFTVTSSRHCPNINVAIKMVGLGSFVFHATETVYGQMMDELAMSLVAYLYFVKITSTKKNHCICQ